MEVNIDQQQTNTATNLSKSGITYAKVFNEINHENYNFQSPPLAPVYRPTKEEFELGPLNYISKIRNEAEKYGIIRIIPPSCFQPPFTVDIDNFRFTPRIQRLNELEAQTRVRLSFLEKLIKYWSLQSHQIKIPSIDKKILDLYKLHKVVNEEGGFDTCSKDRKWSIIANKMGFNCTPQNKGTIASLLRHHYEKIIFPYDLFSNGATYDESSLDELKETLNNDNKNEIDNTELCQKIKIEINDESNLCNNESDKMEIDESKINDEDDKPMARRSSRRMLGQSLCNVKLENNNKELARLQVYSPGPKMSGFSPEEKKNEEDKKLINKLPQCIQCGDTNGQLVACSTCKNNFHIKCLIPPLNELPKSNWNCPRCIAYLVETQPQSYDKSFGFHQSKRTYSLTEFGEIADQFKSTYFNMPCHSVPLELTEKEFWRLVSSYEDDVAVEYGADLHTAHFGSGFPTQKNLKLLPTDLEYLDHKWNLNNLPVLDGSVFKYINTNISGMIVPWNYIGMCFSTFCWHTEDHWSYSINYLHWGEPKCWYGIPGASAEKFEEAIKSVAPELFNSQPDLLHQLVTICNPNVLQNLDVPIYTTVQHAGEFVVTFPRSYHAGFNHGLNFAEAVNFSPSDWLKIGRKCMENYSELKRYPVFSHDELVCKMANDPDILDISIAEATYLDLIEMVEQEKLKRENVLKLGVRKSVRETFELLQDDERQCDFCKTACFLSALNCDCSDCKLVCLKHADKLCTKCKFEEMTLRYRYTLDELPLMLQKMEKRKNEFKEWSEKIESYYKQANSTTKLPTLTASTCSLEDKISFQEFRRQLNIAAIKNYPLDCEIYLKMKSTIEHATACSKAVQDILDQQKQLDEINEQIVKSNRLKNDHLRKAYQRSPIKKSTENSIILRSSSSKTKKFKDQEERTKLEFIEFKQFIDEINNLPCKIPESELINQLFNRCDTIKKSIKEICDYTKEESEGLSSDFIEQLIFEANCISIVDFDEKLDIIKFKLDEIKWIEKCKSFLNQDDNRKKKHQIELIVLDQMIDDSKELLVSTNISQELIVQLITLKEKAENWILKSKNLIDLPVQLLDDSNEFDLNLYNKLPVYSEFEFLVKESDEDNDLVKINLSPYLDKIIKIISNVERWLDNYNKLFPFSSTSQNNQTISSTTESPFFDQIEELYNSGKILGCKINEMNKLHSIYVQFKTWREKLIKLFVKKNSIYNLLNILLPRTKQSVPQSIDLVNMSSKILYQQLKKNYYQQSLKDQNKVDWFKKQLDSKMSRESIDKAYKESILNEEVCMKEIREKNLIRLHSVIDNDSPTRLADKSEDFETEDDILDKNFDIKKKKFCICGKKPSDWMIQCVLCQEYYHLSCQEYYTKNYLKFKKAAPNNQDTNNQTSSSSLSSSDNLDKDNSYFLCILCDRSKHPSIDLVINLSEQLNNRKIRILENELLRCLIQRANNFKYNLQKELNKRSDFNLAYNLVVKAFNNLNNSLANNLSTSNTSTSSTENEVLIKKRKTGQQQNKIKDLKINLTEQTKNVLYNLIWDCSLLQVNLIELKYLWEIHCQANPKFKTSFFITESVNFTLPITDNYLQYKLNDTNLNDKKRKIVDNSTSLNINKQTSTSKQEKTKKQKTLKSNGKSKANENENDICDLNESCLRPRNKNVDWVQCEQCSRWLHFLCCGINLDEINKINEFYCSRCLSEKETENLNKELSADNLLNDNANDLNKDIKNEIKEQNEIDLNNSDHNSSLADVITEKRNNEELNKNEIDNIEAAKSILSLGLGFESDRKTEEQQQIMSADNLN